MGYPVSAAYMAALADTNQVARTVVQVWNENRRLATLPTVSSGSVTSTETAEIRRSCSITLQSRGRTLDDLVWNKPTDLLHPASGNELRIYRGFRYANGITELPPLGVFRLTKPKAVDTPTGLTITINGFDRAGAVKLQTFDAPFVIATGTYLNDVAMTIVGSRIPGATFNLYPTSAQLPALTWAATPGASTNDPMLLLQTAYGDIGFELYFDVNGVLTSRPIPTPGSTPVAWTLAEGAGCTLTSLSKTADQTATYNGVVIIGNGKAKTPYSTPAHPGEPVANGPTEVTIPPVVGEAWTETPDSPINISSDWGKVPLRITSTTIPGPGMTGPTAPTGWTNPKSAQKAADAAARAQFPLVCTALNMLPFTCVPNAAMHEGDVIALTRKRLAVATKVVLSAFSIPLGPKTAQTCTSRPQTQAV